MARFNVNDAEHYGGQGGGGYFKLADDKDTATVHFLYDSVEDVDGYSVHTIEIDGKKKYVQCLREYGQPVDACPFCAKGMVTQVKYFVPLFNVNSGRVETWERGKKFGQKLASLCSRYPHLVSHTFEIERNGRAGDQQTIYEIYETGQTDKTIDEFDVPNPIGSMILDKTADEMNFFNQHGYFEGAEGQPLQRRGDPDTRRTPATTNGGYANGGRREVF